MHEFANRVPEFVNLQILKDDCPLSWLRPRGHQYYAFLKKLSNNLSKLFLLVSPNPNFLSDGNVRPIPYESPKWKFTMEAEIRLHLLKIALLVIFAFPHPFF